MEGELVKYRAAYGDLQAALFDANSFEELKKALACEKVAQDYSDGPVERGGGLRTVISIPPVAAEHSYIIYLPCRAASSH